MPQPLSRVRSNAYVQHDPNVLDGNPKLARLVANILGYWGLIEYRLSLLLVRVLGADAAPALAMFSTLIAQHLQLSALEAAAKSALSDDEYDVFKAAIVVANRVQTPRNHLAHWTWVSCRELPDALLLANPKAAKERDREFLLALERHGSPGIDMEQIAALNSYDPDEVLVYREGDLERAKRDIEEASLIVFLVVIYLDGLFRGRRKPSDPSQARMTRAQVFEQLSHQHLFREAWDRIREDRQKSHQSERGSPQPAPDGS
jgi:hypothetical protein